MDEEFVPEESTSNLPIADISIGENKDVTITNYQYAVKKPKEYENDFMVQVRASNLQKARGILNQAKTISFPIHELLLGAASIAFGATLGALTSGIIINTALGIVMYVICPIITTGTFMSYIFTRRNNINEIHDLAEDILEYMVDPEKAN